MDLEKLATLLAGTHPVTGAFNVDDALAADEFNVANIVRNKTSMTGREVASKIVESEYNALTADKKNQTISLVSSDTLDPFGFAVFVIKDIFTAGSDTVAALAASRTETISYAKDQSLIGKVKHGHVETVRAG